VSLVEDNFVLVVDTNNKAIRQIDLSNESVWTIPLPEMNYPVGIDFNPTDKKVYWTDLRGDVIKRSNLDGTSEEIVTSLHSGSYLFGLAIDMVSGLMYFTEGGADIIAAVTLDGRQHFTLVTEDMDQPQEIALDLERGLMFWTDNGQPPRIEKAAMDGTQRVVVITFDFDTSPTGLTIDNNGGRLYWCDSYTHKIRSVLVDGSDMSIVVENSGTTYYKIAFLADNLYFSAVSESYISKVSLSDTPRTSVQVGPAVFDSPTGITAYRRRELTNDNCPQVHNERKGEILSPGYPGYVNNVYCMITIHMDNPDKKEHVIRLYVEDFDLQDKYDYLVIANNRFSSLQAHSSYSGTNST
ncbi:hypothetical protein NP493_1573g00015, partial [Ridgeia piscesae]